MIGALNIRELRAKRMIGLIHAVVSGLANRIMGVSIGIISVPLTINYLGAERYGVWTLIASTLAWMRLADVGIGLGLNNAIAQAYGSDRPDLIRSHVSTGLALLTAIAIFFGVMVAVAWPWIEWAEIFNVKNPLAQKELGLAMASAIAVFLVGFPLSVISRVYNATQEGKLQNYWASAGSICSLLAMYLVTRTEGGLPWLVFAFSGVGLLVDMLSGLWLFAIHRPDYAPAIAHIRRESSSIVFSVGGKFFLIQIMALVVFESGNFVVAHYLGASQVPAYNVTYKLFGYTALLQTVVFAYLWTAYTEALARGDIDWVQRSFRLNMAFSMGTTLLMVIPLLFVARPFIRYWAGDAAVPTNELVYWMAAWTVINAFLSPVACLFAAAGHLKMQIWCSVFATTSILALSLYLVRHWGSPGVIAAPVISYLIFMCIPIWLDKTFLLRKLRANATTAAGPNNIRLDRGLSRNAS